MQPAGVIVIDAGTAPAGPDWRADDELGAKLHEQAARKRAELLDDALGVTADGAPDGSGRVRVSVRCRPLLQSERCTLGERIEGNGSASFAQWEYESVVADEHSRRVHVLTEARVHGAPTGALTASSYRADAVFGPKADDAAVFDAAVRPLIDHVLAGGDACVLLYGQTGAGKTTTAVATQRLAAAAMLASGRESVEISFFEICGEPCYDLLTDGGRVDGGAALSLREAGDGELRVDGLSEVEASSAKRCDALLAAANASRATAQTEANERSSRSHAVCRLRPAGGAGLLQIVDLAGSEKRQESRAHDAARLAETRAANLALATLKECVRLQALAGGAPAGHVPHRRSKLTRVLRPVLVPGSGARLSVVAHVAPRRSAGQHTAATLEFARTIGGGAPRAELERRRFNEVERWSAERVARWVKELDGGRFAALAPCFGGCTGKALSFEWLGHITKRVVAQGGSAEDASEIYEAFHRLHRRAKAKAKRAPASGGADADEAPGALAVTNP